MSSDNLCVSCHKFYGNPQNLNMCSVCYKYSSIYLDHTRKQRMSKRKSTNSRYPKFHSQRLANKQITLNVLCVRKKLDCLGLGVRAATVRTAITIDCLKITNVTEISLTAPRWKSKRIIRISPLLKLKKYDLSDQSLHILHCFRFSKYYQTSSLVSDYILTVE